MMTDPYLIVEYTCSGCMEAAESDGDCGLICRRCAVQFSGYADGDTGKAMPPGEFAEWFGTQKPEPSSAERLDEVLKRVRAGRA